MVEGQLGLGEKIPCFVVLAVGAGDFNRFQAVVDRVVPFLQLQSRVGSIGEYERVLGVLLNGLDTRMEEVVRRSVR